ncbi:MAG: hypothetical protein R3C68_03080 [Myxococcota bacterium]
MTIRRGDHSAPFCLQQGSDFQGADKDVLTFYMRARTRTLPVEIGVIVDGLVKRAALRSVALAYRAFTKRHLQGYKTLPEVLHGVCQAVEADARNVI